MKKQHVELIAKDRDHCLDLLKKGSLKSRTSKRITALLALDQGQTYEAVKSIAHLSRVSLIRLAKKYASDGLACLYDSPRPGRPIEISAEQKDKITLLSCEDPPAGHSQWSLRLLADKVVELGHCDHISHTQVNKILKKRKSNRT